MNKSELKSRTKKFALRIIKLVDELPNTKAGHTIGNQIIRSGTSIAANYRAACRARSSAEFISKLAIVEEESDETLFWLEADELTAIFTAAGKTAKANKNLKSSIKNPKS